MQPIAVPVQWAVLRIREAGSKLVYMMRATRTFLLLGTALLTLAGSKLSSGPEYTSDGQMKFPEHYRDWVYLSTGFDMSYSAGSQMADHHMFDNVFADPAAYKSFLQTGTWPDKTVLVLEHREATGKGSINQRGNFQDSVMGVEVHVKDEARFPGKWGFFGFDDGNKTAKMIPAAASCYSCHADHAAVDTTFVQFYPTLLPLAKSKATLSAAFKKESGAE